MLRRWRPTASVMACEPRLSGAGRLPAERGAGAVAVRLRVPAPRPVQPARLGRLALLAASLAASLWAPRAAAQGPAAASANSPGIYSCTTPDGRRVTSDRPIPACAQVDQRVLNSDGSLRRIEPPSLTPDERAAKEAEERRLILEAAARRDAVRRDRNLRNRYPDEPTHQRARESALEPTRVAMRASEARLVALASERKPLLDEVQFYVGRQLPAKIKAALDANDAATEAQRQAIQNQLAEIDRVNRLYDAELERLRRLWAGAAPGSLGPVNVAPGAPAAGRAAP